MFGYYSTHNKEIISGHAWNPNFYHFPQKTTMLGFKTLFSSLNVNSNSDKTLLAYQTRPKVKDGLPKYTRKLAGAKQCH